MGKGNFFMLKAIIFDLDTEWKQARQNIPDGDRYHPLPGMRQILQTLTQEGIHLTLVSSLSECEIRERTQSMKIQNYFQHLLSSDEVEHTKPTADLLTLALQKSGVTLAEALVVADSYCGIQTAKAATLPCIGFLHPHSENTDFRDADILLESFDELSTSFFFHVHSRFHGQPITIASTRRLWIRELAIENIPALCTIYQDPNIRRFITEIEDCMEDEAARQRAYIHTVYPFYEYGLWGIFHKASGTLIGRCGIENHIVAGKEEITLSYLLDSKHWGHGYASEACKAVLHYAQEELDIHRIIAVIDYENQRSLRTATNLGMKLEKELIYQNRPCFQFALE